ncbi:MAG: UDP-N-acetylmuramate dehydrogenase [Planctomycetota bacterium]
MAREFQDCGHTVCSAVPLSTVTSFRIGGPADYLVEPRSVDELARLVDRCMARDIPVRVLGAGSNLLVADAGVRAAVFRLSRLTAVRRAGSRVTCEAGLPLPRLVRKAEEWGLSGLEPLAGIPGSVGGAIAMNAGGRNGCVANALRSVTTIDRYGFLRARTPRRLGMRYRESRLKPEIAVAATFELEEADPAEVTERRRAVLDEKSRTQPLGAWSAGCVFKNAAERSAGELIERAGLKGERVGHAVVSTRHANFIINEGNATARDVRALIDRVRRGVRQSFGVGLDLEIEMWN